MRDSFQLPFSPVLLPPNTKQWMFTQECLTGTTRPAIQCTSLLPTPLLSTCSSPSKPVTGSAGWASIKSLFVLTLLLCKVIIMYFNYRSTKNLIKDLQATAAVFVEMSLYNPPSNTFVDVKYITEFTDFCLPQSTAAISPLHVLDRFVVRIRCSTEKF